MHKNFCHIPRIYIYKKRGHVLHPARIYIKRKLHFNLFSFQIYNNDEPMLSVRIACRCEKQAQDVYRRFYGKSFFLLLLFIKKKQHKISEISSHVEFSIRYMNFVRRTKSLEIPKKFPNFIAIHNSYLGLLFGGWCCCYWILLFQMYSR